MSSNAVVELDVDKEDICMACNDKPARLLSRKKKLCEHCYIRFIRGKQRKHMNDDKYKVKYGKQAEEKEVSRVLLSFSGGVSSLVLIDIICSLLQEQYEAHKGRQGFELVIFNIDEFASRSLNQHVSDVMKSLLSMYGQINISTEVVDLRSLKLNKDQIRRIVFEKGYHGIAEEVKDIEKTDIVSLLQSCKDKSAAEDLLSIIYEEVIVEAAFIQNCNTIIFGHSMTRLANEVLSLTVKGRGSQVHTQIADRSITFKDKEISIIFPLRDIFYAEIEKYVQLEDLQKYELKSNSQKSKIVTNMTVNELISQYLTTLDRTGYASTASTVVKTAEKLGAPKSDGENSSTCQNCGNKVHHDPAKWLNRITVNEAAPLQTEKEEAYASAYRAKFVQKRELLSDDLDDLTLCYGCTVTLSKSNGVAGILWPLAPRYTEKDVLDEFSL